MWYFDGVQYYALPEGYTVKNDGFAYDENGNMVCRGKKQRPTIPQTIGEKAGRKIGKRKNDE